jgi:hypothetical protein
VTTGIKSEFSTHSRANNDRSTGNPEYQFRMCTCVQYDQNKQKTDSLQGENEVTTERKSTTQPVGTDPSLIAMIELPSSIRSETREIDWGLKWQLAARLERLSTMYLVRQQVVLWFCKGVHSLVHWGCSTLPSPGIPPTTGTAASLFGFRVPTSVCTAASSRTYFSMYLSSSVY